MAGAYRQAVGMKTPEEGLLPETGTLLENGVWNAGEQQMSEAGSPSGKPVGSFDENFEARINGLSEKNASWRTVFERVSFAGTIVCTLAMLLGYWGCLRMFSTAVLVKWTFVQEWIATYGSGRRRVTVKQSDRISTPLTYGILHPTILLPLKNIESEEKLALILQHELVHIRRFDAATKIFMVLTLCIHWFNPLVWVLYGMMNKDMELSCDEAVLNRAGMGARKEYARTLLAMEEKRSRASALCSGFGKNAIEERVTAVMKHKKRTRAAIAAAGVLIVAISLLFATVAENKETNTGNTEQQETQLPSNENKDELPIDPPEEDSAVQDEKAKAGGRTGTRNAGGKTETGKRISDHRT